MAAAAAGGSSQATKTVARAAVQMKPSMRGFFNTLTAQLTGPQMASAGAVASRNLSRGLNSGLMGRGGILRSLDTLGGKGGKLFGNSLTSATTGAIASLTHSIGNGVVGAVRTATTAMTTFGMTTATVTAGATAALVAMTAFGGFNRALSIENAQSKLGSLGHDTQAVANIMNSALASVEGTIYSLDGAATAATNAVASGIQTGDSLTNWLKLIADTATVANAPLDDIARVLNRVQANGRAFTLELNMLADRGIPIFTMLAETTGQSMVDLRKSIAAGEISTSMLAETLEKKLGGAALASASTTSGAFANMRIAFSRFGAVIATKTLPYARLFFLEIRDMVDMLNNRFGPAMAATTEAMGKRFEPVITSMTERLGAFLDNLKTNKGSFPLVAGITGAFSGIYKEVSPVMTWLTEKIPVALRWAAGVVGVLITKMFQGTDTRDSWLDSFITGIRYINRELTPIYEMIGTYLPKILSRAEVMFGQLFRAAFIDSPTHDSWLGSIVTLITTYLPKALGTITPVLDSLFNKMFIGVDGEESWVNQFIDLLGEVLVMAYPLLEVFTGQIVPAIIGGLEQIIPHVGEFVKALATVGVALITQLAPVVVQLITAIAPLIVSLAGAFIAATPMIVSFIGVLANVAGGISENEGLVQALVIGLGSAFLIFKAMAGTIGIVTSIGTSIAGVVKVVTTFAGGIKTVALLISGPLVRAFRLVKLGLLLGPMRTLTLMFPVLGARVALFVTALKASRIWILASAAAAKIATGAQWLWNAALTANPIGLVIAGIALLTAGLIWFFTQTETGRMVWAALVEGMKAGFASLSKWMGEAGDNIAKWWNGLTEFFVDSWNNVVGFFSDTLTNIGNWFNDVFTGITDSFRAVADWFINIFNNVNEFFQSVVDGITAGIDRVVGWVQGLLNIFPEWLRDLIGMGDTTLTVQSQAIASNLPKMATGGDILSATNVTVGEKEPETIVNRGVMNKYLEASTDRFKRLEGQKSANTEPVVQKIINVTVVQNPWEDMGQFVKNVVHEIQFNSVR